MTQRISIIHRLVLAVLVCIIPSMTAFGADNLSMGDAAYNKKDFNDALHYYNAALSDGVSTELYYNIGNTQYRLGNLGQAIIAYERALKLDPSNDLARRNLEFVKTKITDRPEDDSTFLYNMHKRIVAWASPEGWAWVAFGFFVVFVGMVALYIFTSDISVRKVGFFGGLLILAVFTYALIIAWQTSDNMNSHETAVVIAPTTNLCSSPSTPKDKTDKIVPIHEGTKVEITDSVATPDDPASLMWYHVKINNTTSAWVASADVERI